MYRREPGDWDCNFCGNTGNFKSRTKCRKCGKGKYDKNRSGNIVNQRKAGDWVCPGCNFLCYAYKEECSKCKIKRPNNNNNNSFIRREGDWDCDKCGKLQFKRNNFCRDCGNPQEGTNNSEETNGKDSDEDDSLCKICMNAENNTMLFHEGIGHTCVCHDCAELLVAQNLPCPICRRSIENTIRNYNI